MQQSLTVFVDQPGLTFVRQQVEVRQSPSDDRSRLVLTQAGQLSEPLDDRQRVAFDLYSASFFQPSEDSRLLMLTMAIETLLELGPRSPSARTHVSAMIAATDANPDLTWAERNSLKGSLVWLLDESIGQAGRRLVRGLEPRTYGQMAPSQLFTRCYEVRSALTHGRMPRPTRWEVGLLSASLELLVGDILAGRLLDEVPD